CPSCRTNFGALRRFARICAYKSIAFQRARASGSAVCKLAFIGKAVRGRLTVSFHSGIRSGSVTSTTYYNPWRAPLESTPQSGFAVREEVLDNGLRVLIQPVHAAPLATVWCWYRVGSSDEIHWP